MRFKITSKDCFGQIKNHYYDNLTQDILTEDGNVVDLASDPRCKNLVDSEKRSRKVRHYKKHFHELRIQLGMSCNFHCRYCIEGHSGDNLPKEAVVAMPPKQTAENFCKLLRDNDIQASHIVFWGGEPLVYWKTILELVPRLEELYKDNSDLSFGMCTNGSLLTLDKVKYMLDHNIALTMSHDGWSFKTYRSDNDPLDNPKIVEALQYYYDHTDNSQSINFNVVITPENSNILKLGDWFKEKVGRPIQPNIECIVKNDRVTSKIVSSFDTETTKRLIQELFYCGVLDPEVTPLPSLRSITSRFILSLVNKWRLDHQLYPCGAPFTNQVAVDLQGNVLRCHGTDPSTNTIGHLSNITDCINSSLIPITNRDNCINCPVLALCRGRCPLVEQKDLDYYCKTLKFYYSAFFAAAWKILFDLTIVKIEPIE